MDNYQNENNNNNGYYTAPEAQGYNQQSNHYMTEQSDKVSVGFCILGWIVPIFALIYFLTKRKEKPKGAKAVGICGLVSFILNLLVVIISLAVTGSLFNKAMDTVDEVMDSSIVEEFYNDSLDDFTLYYDEVDDYSDTNDTSESNHQSANSNVSSNWKDYKVVVNDAVIQLPIQYSEFSKITGYTFDDSQDAQQTLKNDYTTTVALRYNGYNISATFINANMQITTLDNCYIAAIYVSNYNGDNNIKFANNLTVDTNITKEKVIEMFGSPDYEFDEDNYHIMKYEDANNSYNGFDITIKDNVIIDMSTECVDVK